MHNKLGKRNLCIISKETARGLLLLNGYFPKLRDFPVQESRQVDLTLISNKIDKCSTFIWSPFYPVQRLEIIKEIRERDLQVL